VETELILADLQTLTKQAEPNQTATKEERARWNVITKLKTVLDGGKLARDVIVDKEERLLVRDLQLLTMKPMLYVANVSEDQLKEKNDMLSICAETESQLAGLSEEEQKEYLQSLGLEASGLDRLIKKAYGMLGLISFLTTGVIEARAWTVENGTKAPQAAGVIHTDFEKKFIKADCVSFEDFVAVSGWKKGRELGKVRVEGKEYIIRDGDVVEFKIGA
jgi:ribosome-binding ATPase YchF (GTP1/OBG family)